MILHRQPSCNSLPTNESSEDEVRYIYDLLRHVKEPSNLRELRIAS